MQGYVKIHRKIIDWEWYTDVNAKTLFLHLILIANHKDRQWRGKMIKRGELVTSLVSLAESTGLSVQKVRAALKNLEKTGDIKVSSTNKNTLILVVNYDAYQVSENDENNQKTTKKQTNNTLDNKQITRNSTNKQHTTQQTNNKQITTNKNVKNDKNIYTHSLGSQEGHEKKEYGIFFNVFLTDYEYDCLMNECGAEYDVELDCYKGAGYDLAVEYINKLSASKKSTGNQYQDDYAKIIQFLLQDERI